MKKANVLLGGMAAALLMTGCATVPDLTQTETELISEYAVGVLLKYDKGHGRRLVIPQGMRRRRKNLSRSRPWKRFRRRRNPKRKRRRR